MFRYTYIDKAGNLLCDVSEYVRKHNVVYRTPAMLPREGLPLGNGFMGGLVYHTDRELCMRINRTDSFDYARKPGRFGAWGHEWEEECTTLASCGTVKISDGTPAFAWEYLDDYENTLDLGRAEIGMRSETPFSSWRAKGYGSPDDRVIVWEIEAESEEPLARTVRLERYGTRGFFHYYESFTRETSRRLYGVEAKAADDCMLVTQKLNGCVFTTAVRVECEGARYQVLNRREAECVLPKAEKAAFRVVIATALSTCGEDTGAEAVRILNAAAERGEDVCRSRLEWWREYWNRSFIQIEDDFAENFYYINRYQFGSAGFGSFPPSVFGSLWTARGDMRNWGHFYHWNDQMQFWPCDAWDQGELLAPYFAYRRRMLPKAIDDGREIHGADGAWYSDISSADGDQAVEPDTAGNLTCGPMIALQMYRHYRHFPDRQFLLETAYPVMKACADLYLNLLRKGADGRLHLRDATALEGYLYLDDTVSDWAMIRALMKALSDVADEAGADDGLRAAWKDCLDSLYEPPVIETEGVRSFAYGRHPDGTPCTGGEYPEGDMGMSGVGTLMCVFPGSTYGKYTEDEPHCGIVKDMVRLLAEGKYGAAWYIDLSALARFGYADALWAKIRGFTENAAMYPNGLVQGDGGDFFTARAIPPGTDHTPWGEMHEKDRGERVVYRSDRFFHCYTEPEGGICTAVNDSLLQSWEGIIRVFPAAGDGVFSLHAEGDFMVTAQKTDGKVRFVSIESRRGGRVTLQSPFGGCECVRIGGEGREQAFDAEETGEQRLLRFETEAGRTYIVFSRRDHIDGSYPTRIKSKPNTGLKHCGKNTIGRARDF